MRLIPIVVEAETPAGFASSDPWSPTLDGILAFSYMQEKLGPDFGTNTDYRPVEGLPLAVDRHGGLWWYRCGSPEYEPMAQRDLHINRRFDALDAERYVVGKRKVDTSSGPFKAMRKPRFQHICPRVTWRAVGDPDEVRRLLERIPAIGTCWSKGFGRVARWTVTEGGDGSVHRPVPLEYAVANGIVGRRVHHAIRPPTHLPENRMECVVPERRAASRQAEMVLARAYEGIDFFAMAAVGDAG